MPDAVRSWCGLARYPSRPKPFLVGTVVLPADARHDQIIQAIRDHALQFLPDGFDIIEPRCGALIFHPE